MSMIPSVWIVTKPAANFQAQLHVYQVPPGTLVATNAILSSDLLDTLVSMMPEGRRRVPRFPSQAVTVLENWL